MSNTNIIKELPEHLQSTVIKLLCEYLVMLEHLPCSDDIYLHVVSHSIDHLRELPNTSVVNNHLKDLYEAMLTHLSNDLSNTDLMDKIKAFKLLHPEVVK